MLSFMLLRYGLIYHLVNFEYFVYTFLFSKNAIIIRTLILK